MTTEQQQILEALSLKLIRGEVKLIAERLKMARGHVSRVLSPRNDQYNEQVIAEALAVIEERQERGHVHLKKIQKIYGNKSV